MIRVFVVDDEEPMRRLLQKELARKGFEVDTAPDGESALRKLKKSTFDVILLDILMPGMDGITLMKRLKGDPAAPVIVVLTGTATIETAVEAMKNGAYDYLTKPYKLNELEIVINRAFEFGQASGRSQMFQQELVRKEQPSKLIGRSESFKRITKLIRKIAPTDSTVLVLGESGTGKELIANNIWHFSKRNDQPFIALNCASLSGNLIESELFGHEKGAFTTAYQRKHGIVEVADGGTLFLDEIAELPFGLQAKLLRFLDSGEFRRVGSNKNLKVDVRVIAATNKNLQHLVSEGGFREDLFYRLNVINILMPPIRDRMDDLPGLLEHFIEKYSRIHAKKIEGLSPAASKKMSSYGWPGNVRELENEIERAIILCDSDTIGDEDLTIHVSSSPTEGALRMLQEIEQEHIQRVLRETGGNQTRASQILGINRKTLHLKLKKFGISTNQKQ